MSGAGVVVSVWRAETWCMVMAMMLVGQAVPSMAEAMQPLVESPIME